MATFSSVSTGLLYAHVPLDEPPDLTLGVAAFNHARDELAVLLLGFTVLLRTERDHRQQILDLREDAFLDDLTDFFVRGPARVLAAILGTRPQRELDDLVAEVLRVGDPGGLLNLGELLIEKLAIHHLTGVGVLEVLVFDPGVRIVDIAVEQILAVVRIGFQIGLLNLVADELGIARRELGLDEFKIAFFDLVRKLLAADRL